MALNVTFTKNKTVPEQVYVAKLMDLEEQMHPQYGAGIRWTFEIQDHPEHAGTSVTGMSSTKVSPKSKIFTWARAFGVTLVQGESFDLESFLGQSVRIKVKNKTQTKIVEGAEVTQTFSNVEKLAPLKPAGDVSTTPAEVSAPVQDPVTVHNDDSDSDTAVSDEDDFDF